jgi:hypothetical protein
MSRALIDPATWRCRHCGGRERYHTGHCVVCQRARMREARRNERMAHDPTELRTRAHDFGCHTTEDNDMSTKLTDDEIDALRTQRRMVIQIGYDHWAVAPKDAIKLIEIFERSRKVERIHSSNYSKSAWLIAEDQSTPFTSANMEPVQVPMVMREDAASDPFSAATKAVS